jgi:hypothetical protein
MGVGKAPIVQVGVPVIVKRITANEVALLD